MVRFDDDANGEHDNSDAGDVDDEMAYFHFHFFTTGLRFRSSVGAFPSVHQFLVAVPMSMWC